MISVKNVTKCIGKQSKVIVNDITFTVNEGEVVGYIGPNGAGKSTTIKMLCGIFPPTSGRILVNDRDPFKFRKQNAFNIGVVFGQRTQLWWDLPLIDSFNVIRNIYKIPKGDYADRLHYLLHIFDMEKHLSSRVRSLSLGERMKADLIASMLHNPRILFLDEPTIGLDYNSKKNMREAISQMNKELNTTILLTSHDLDDIDLLCHRVILLDRGKIIFDGEVDYLKKKYSTYRSIIIEKSEQATAAIAELLENYSLYCLQGANSVVLKIPVEFQDYENVLGFLVNRLKSNFSLQNQNLETIIDNYYNLGETL